MAETTLTVNGRYFQLELPYSAGMTINAGEANALNSAYKDGVRNRFAPKLKALEQARVSDEDIDAEFRAAAADFSFNPIPGRRRSVDKVTEMTHQLAVEFCRAAALRAKVPIDWNALSTDQQEAMVVRALSLNPQLREEAERRLTAITETMVEISFED